VGYPDVPAQRAIIGTLLRRNGPRYGVLCSTGKIALALAVVAGVVDALRASRWGGGDSDLSGRAQGATILSMLKPEPRRSFHR
jgi:hypothetical protein